MASSVAHRVVLFVLLVFLSISISRAAPAETIPLSPAVSYPAGDLPLDMLIGDLNGDGRADIVVTNAGANEATVGISVLVNLGDGTFESPVKYLEGTFARTLAASDLDGDGDLDLAVGLTNEPQVLAILENAGDGTFGSPTFSGTASGDFRPDASHSADFDGDGDLDVVLGLAGFGVAAICRNPGDGTLPISDIYTSENPAYTSDLTIADFDGDQDVDLATVRTLNADPPSVLLNRGDGTFDPPVAITAQTFAHLAIAAGDVDRDGDQDLVLVAEGNRIDVFLNDGAAAFAPAVWYPLEAFTGLGARILLADLDGDAAPEAVFPSRNELNIRVLRNNGAGVFAAPDEYPAGVEAVMPRAADLDGDGDRDVAVTGFVSGGVVVFSNASAPTDVPAGGASAATLLLISARPNPMSGETSISYRLAEPGHARLSLYDASGRLVRVLVDGAESVGSHQATWSGRNSSGELVAPGRYFLTLEGRASATTPVVVVR